MAILKIARMGHPVLRRRADEVADPTAPEIRRLAEDMLETMRDAPGTGLAAPQVHVPLRVVIFEVAEARAEREKSQSVPLTVMVNPVIEPLDDARALGWEGCLSVPGLAGMVPRHERIRYRFRTLGGETVEREAEGFHARVVQHECDHLDGVLYPQRMDDLSLLVFTEELKHGAPRPKGAPAEAEGRTAEEVEETAS
ncbi:MAG: peptide deformylase [Alphaproteobacteria bacterium]|nr:peptide deformylase [Alphaproteobacteria bacterium]